jgi:heterodisulfide reductase subunit C
MSDQRATPFDAGLPGGEQVSLCYQCGRCTAGCPVAHLMDIPPNAVLRMLQTGQEAEVMASHTLWLCVSCGTCATRCPNGIDIGTVLDAVRQEARRRHVPAAERRVHLMHEAFVRSLGRGGRLHEVSMLVDYKVRSLDLFTDVPSGIVMFLRGKIPVIPERIRGIKEIKRMFEECGE